MFVHISMRFITLSKQEQTRLLEIKNNSTNKVERSRATSLILSHKGSKIKEISEIVDSSRITIERLFNNWEKEGYSALKIKDGRGAKPKLSEYREVIDEYMKEFNRNIDLILDKLAQDHRVYISKSTLKRFLKR